MCQVAGRIMTARGVSPNNTCHQQSSSVLPRAKNNSQTHLQLPQKDDSSPCLFRLEGNLGDRIWRQKYHDRRDPKRFRTFLDKVGVASEIVLSLQIVLTVQEPREDENQQGY
jgi:hypothetical protein